MHQLLKMAPAILAAQLLLQANIAHEILQLSPMVTLTHPLVKIRTDTPVSSISSISLAGNEYESFQVKLVSKLVL